MQQILPFLVVAAQPTIDHTIIVPNVSLNKAYRIEHVSILPSGKALNTARSLQKLGSPVHIAALLAGHNGHWISNRLDEIGIPFNSTWMNGENRVAVSVYDPVKNTLTEFIEDTDGPIDIGEWDRFQKLIIDMLPGSSALILAGRAPRGAPEEGYLHLAKLANRSNIPVYIDCYGPLLEKALQSHVAILKINQREINLLLGAFPQSQKECVNSARVLLNWGIEKVIITLGVGGAIGVHQDGAWLAEAPFQRGAAIGSGDAMLAGLISAIFQKQTFENALKFGVAVGAANVLIPGAGEFNLDDVDRLKKQVKLTQIA